MCEEEEVQTIVIDNGSKMLKVGFAGDEAPRSVFPSVVGCLNNKLIHHGIPLFQQCPYVYIKNDVFVGDEACSKASILSLEYPIERGIIKNWNDM